VNSVTKTCRLCDESKALDEFYARKGSTDGYRSECKSCVKARTVANWHANHDERLTAAKARYADNADEINARRRASRSSMTDDERRAELERNRAWIARNQERARDVKSRYNSANSDRKREWNRSWYERNREHVRNYRRKQWIANRDELLRAGAAYRAANRERLAARARAYYQVNKHQKHAYQAAYRASNKQTIQRLSHLRYLRSKSGKFQAPPPELLAAKWRYWGNSCWMCGGSATTIDHVKPLSKGGSHLLANLRPACKPCNSSKHARWFGASKLSLFMRE
jgi:5-methylcytosine-specific restriction endonuclease McrA